MPLMRLRDIDKSYGTVHALKDVSLDLAVGRVHALVGDNGAGKSTLVKIISGALQPDHGEIFLNDTPVHFSSPSDALNRGIATVFQDLALIPTRDVAHNMFVGNELRRWGILVDHRRMAREAHAVLKGLHIHNMPSVKKLVSRLSDGQRQAVAIGRAVHEGRSLLVLDEPTAALGVRESHQVLSLIARLRDQGMAVSSTLGARAFTRVAADPACGPVTEQGVAWPKRACRFPPRQQEYVWVAANIADPFYARRRPKDLCRSRNVHVRTCGRSDSGKGG